MLHSECVYFYVVWEKIKTLKVRERWLAENEVSHTVCLCVCARTS